MSPIEFIETLFRLVERDDFTDREIVEYIRDMKRIDYIDMRMYEDYAELANSMIAFLLRRMKK